MADPNRVSRLALWLVLGLALSKYRCEFVNINCIFATAYLPRSAFYPLPYTAASSSPLFFDN